MIIDYVMQDKKEGWLNKVFGKSKGNSFYNYIDREEKENFCFFFIFVWQPHNINALSGFFAFDDQDILQA